MGNNIKCEHKNPEGETKENGKNGKEGPVRKSFENNEKRQKHTSQWKDGGRWRNKRLEQYNFKCRKKILEMLRKLTFCFFARQVFPLQKAQLMDQKNGFTN